jgi:hypothetical protein
MRLAICAVHEYLVGTFRTWRDVRLESAFGVNRKSDFGAVRSAFDSISDIGRGGWTDCPAFSHLPLGRKMLGFAGPST